MEGKGRIGLGADSVDLSLLPSGDLLDSLAFTQLVKQTAAVWTWRRNAWAETPVILGGFVLKNTVKQNRYPRFSFKEKPGDSGMVLSHSVARSWMKISSWISPLNNHKLAVSIWFFFMCSAKPLLASSIYKFTGLSFPSTVKLFLSFYLLRKHWKSLMLWKSLDNYFFTLLYYILL